MNLRELAKCYWECWLACAGLGASLGACIYYLATAEETFGFMFFILAMANAGAVVLGLCIAQNRVDDWHKLKG